MIPEVTRATSDRHRVELGGLAIDALDSGELIAHAAREMERGRGGWILTANIDYLARANQDPSLADLFAKADWVVADGQPLIWVSRLRGDPLPARVAGSDLVWLLAETTAAAGKSIFLLGGAGDAARRAGEVLAARYPGLRIAGWACPVLDEEMTAEEVMPIADSIRGTEPAVVYVALGSPKQDRLIALIRGAAPNAWWLGCGASLDFVSRRHRRAPLWAQRAGVEWLYRLLQEPIRLAPRYLVRDLPFAVRLLIEALIERGARGLPGRR
jgi:N-acetylglucosaminyldiphosphoundecaprenol N-acetyl-beta-D-mannosaminyltransferase